MQVLKSFPLHPTLYADDVAQIITPTIERYGSREWQLIVQTNELHGHLGIYSLLGSRWAASPWNSSPQAMSR